MEIKLCQTVKCQGQHRPVFWLEGHRQHIDEYRLSTFLKDDFENTSLACACSRKEYSLADFSGRRLSKASPLQYLLTVAVLHELSCFSVSFLVIFVVRFAHSCRRGYYISHSGKKTIRVVHCLGRCYMLPGVDYLSFSYAGVQFLASDEYDCVCKWCARASQAKTDPGSSGTNTSSSSDE